ncbi:MAG: hypothetical protein A2Y56_08220 [Candidatus Aminicenantes bacterium RBG_13_63_10]|nr:MAG: hypothetical protein A2Y56_08220 [Candidatus Aminicenantes bacterium RBG_13_63_10]
MNMRYLAGVTTLEYDPALCTGCGRCAEVCPHGVFALEEKRAKAVLTDSDLCMECGACARNCADGAITVRPGVGCAWAILRSRVLGAGKDAPCCGD